METNSRVKKIVFGHDLYKYVNEISEKADEHIEDILEDIRNNEVKELKFKDEAIEKWKNFNDMELIQTIDDFLRYEGGFLIQIEMPVPYDFSDNMKSWSSGGFGYYSTMTIYVKDILMMWQIVENIEENFTKKCFEDEKAKK